MAEKDTWPDTLTDSFHRARRNLVLMSAILLSWEFLGINAGTSLKAPLVDASVTLANPSNIPVLIFLMVIFFFIRFVIEWFQCHPSRRLQRASIYDLTLSSSIAFCAITLFLYQTINNKNLFEGVEQENLVLDLVVFIFVSVATLMASYFFATLTIFGKRIFRKKHNKINFIYFMTFLMVFSLSSIMIRTIPQESYFNAQRITSLIGLLFVFSYIILLGLLSLILRRYRDFTISVSKSV